jgi:hypothetical protein
LRKIADYDTFWEREMRRIERGREEEERLDRTDIWRQGVGLVGVLP